MSNIIEYFSSVGKGIVSLVKGMQVTGKELVTKKITECYPENRDNLNISDRFRAVLTLRDVDGHHKCIGCGICQMNCPNGTITLQTKMVDLPDGKKKKVLDKYMYDLGSCTFCMLCVTTCPQGALEFSNDFEQSVFTREKLVKELNAGLENPPIPAPKPRPAAAPAAVKPAANVEKTAPAKDDNATTPLAGNKPEEK